MHTYLSNLYQQYPSGRFLTVDVLRGLMVAAMILVNNPGSWEYVYPPMRHASWHGWTPTDLIFPFFLFIVGLSIVMAQEPGNRQRTASTAVYKNIFLRAAKLIALGLFLNLFYYNFYQEGFSWFEEVLPNVRIMGVLQRIGIVYLATCLLVLHFQLRGRFVWLAGLLAGYSILLLGMSYGETQQFSGVLEHGNSFPAYMDSVILGSNHVYYKTALPFGYDPEGLLSTLPSIATCLAGALVGTYIQQPGIAQAKKLQFLVAIGLAAAVSGHMLQSWLPINKTLWTPTFVLLTAGLSSLTLAALIWILEIKRWRLWSTPFAVCGLNAITFYMLQGVFSALLLMVQVEDAATLKSWLFQSAFQPLFGDYNGSVLFAVVFLCLVYLPLKLMYERRIFLKL